MCAVLKNFLAAHEKQRNLRAVSCPEASLRVTEAMGVKRDLPFRPQPYLRLVKPIAADLNWFGERLLFEEEFIPIIRVPHQSYGVPPAQRHVTKLLAGEVED